MTEGTLARRDLLIVAGKLIGGASLLAMRPAYASPDNLTPQEGRLGDIVERIKAFETLVGEKPLTFKEAKEYLPLLAEHFTVATASPTPPNILAENTYVLRKGYPSLDIEQKEFQAVLNKQLLPHDTSVVKSLLEDYPAATFSEAEAQSIVFKTRSRAFLDIPTGWVTGNKAFIVLDRTNPRTLGSEDDDPDWQYKGLGTQVDCQNSTSVVIFRSVTQHEWTHLDHHSDGLPLETEVVESYNKARESHDLLIKHFTIGEKKHFSIKLSYKDLASGAPVEDFLNEFASEYTIAEISSKSDLAYVTAYGFEPYEFANFTLVLNQAGISPTELYQMKRFHQIKEFLIKIGLGARNLTFPNEMEALDFAVSRLLLNRTLGGGAMFRPILWTEFAPYYEGVDLRIYDYVDPHRLNFPMFYGHPDSKPYHLAHAMLSCTGWK